MKEKKLDLKKLNKKDNCLLHSLESPFEPHYLNEWWVKKKHRLTRNQCIILGRRLDEGWKIKSNTLDFIHIIYRTEEQLLPIGLIYKI